MAKNGHFFMEFWPAFDIFHRLRPYLCSKREVLGFHKQATHRRPGDEPFFTLGSNVHGWGWPKNGPFWTKNVHCHTAISVHDGATFPQAHQYLHSPRHCIASCVGQKEWCSIFEGDGTALPGTNLGAGRDKLAGRDRRMPKRQILLRRCLP